MAEYKSIYTHPNSNNFLNRAIEAFMRVSRTDHAKELFTSAVSNGFKPDERTIAVLIDGYLKHTDVNRAKDVMKSMELFGLKPSIKILNLWMLHYLKEHQLDKARSLFQALKSHGLTPNATTFLNFIRHFLLISDFASASKIKQNMFQMGIKPNVAFYNAIIQSLFQKQALAEVESTLAEMETNSIAPDENTFNVLIEGFSRVNMLDKAQDLIRKMAELEMKPSIITFNRLLASQAHALDVEQTKNILNQMNELGLQFNAFTYAALLKGLIAKQKYQEAVAMLFRMEENKVMLPVEIFSSLVKLCCEHNLESAVYLLRNQLMRHDLAISSHIYGVLIKYYLRHRNYKQVDALLLEMQRTKNLVPGLHIFATLLNHFVEHLDIPRINQTLEQMKSMNLEFNKVIYNIVMKAFYVHCKCLDGGMVYRSELVEEVPGEGSTAPLLNVQAPAIRRTSVAQIKRDFEQAFKIPFRPSVHVFNDLMNNFFYSGRYIEALECYDELLSCDLVPNLYTMTVVVKSRLYLGQIDEAKMVIQRMSTFGLVPTTFQCALIHHALCRELRTEDAEVFMEEISRIHRIRINYVFYASLIYAYSRRYDHYNVFRTFELLRAADMRPDTEACNYVLISMFEVGQFEKAHEFFQSMVSEGIRRNNYTYAIMSDRHFYVSSPEQMKRYLEDSVLPGNTIDAYPFNRILRHYYDLSEMDRVAEFVGLMSQLFVRYNWQTWEFVSYLFYRSIEADGNLSFARRILEKALIDLESLEELDTQMVQILRDAYEDVGDHESIASLDAFLERLPELREKITQISPSLRENIENLEHNKQETRTVRYKIIDSKEDDPPSAATRKELSSDGIPLVQESDQDLHAELQMLSKHINQRPQEKELEKFISEYLSNGKTGPRKE